jgi:lipoic acid synthetase
MALRAFDETLPIEVLIPDFRGRGDSLKHIIAAGPCVIGHNLETVRSLYATIKPDSDYNTSLSVLRMIKRADQKILTKSSIMLGMGETKEDLVSSLQELKQAACDIVVMGQYLAPSKFHYPVQKFLRPQEFAEYERLARQMGFSTVLSKPLARSSLQAHQLYLAASARGGRGNQCMT